MLPTNSSHEFPVLFADAIKNGYKLKSNPDLLLLDATKDLKVIELLGNICIASAGDDQEKRFFKKNINKIKHHLTEDLGNNQHPWPAALRIDLLQRQLQNKGLTDYPLDIYFQSQGTEDELIEELKKEFGGLDLDFEEREEGEILKISGNLSKEAISTLLEHAIRHTNVELLQFLLDHGLSLERIELDNLFSTLGYSASWGYVEEDSSKAANSSIMIKTLLSAGIKVKPQDIKSAVMLADRYPQILRWVIEASGLDVHHDTIEGKTVLGLAVESNRPSILKAILETFQLDINAKDLFGRSPLHLACSSAIDMIQPLIEQGAKRDVVDDQGQTIQDYLFWTGNWQLLPSDEIEFIHKKLQMNQGKFFEGFFHFYLHSSKNYSDRLVKDQMLENLRNFSYCIKREVKNEHRQIFKDLFSECVKKYRLLRGNETDRINLQSLSSEIACIALKNQGYLIPNSSGSFSAKGIQFLIDYHKSKKNLDDTFNCDIWTKESNHLEEFKKLKENGLSKGALLIQSGKHFSPVYWEKNGEGYHFLLTDAAQNPMIQNLCVKIRQLFPDAKIYRARHQRQFTEAECGVIGIKDIVELNKIPDLFERIQKFMEEEQPDGTIEVSLPGRAHEINSI